MTNFIRYLAAKQTVDDRALNTHVYETLRAELPPGPLDVLEVGAGTGAMLDRLVARGLLAAGAVSYTHLDVYKRQIEIAVRALAEQSVCG